MKTILRSFAALLLLVLLTGCDAFHKLTRSKLKAAQGRAYELIVVCPQQEWIGELGDSLRAVLTAPVPYLNQPEPYFDVLRVTERGFSGMIADHRNILKVLVDPALKETSVAVQYDVTAEPQIIMTLQGPSDAALTAYVSDHRNELLQVLEKTERDRNLKTNQSYHQENVERAILKTFDVEMTVPKGYVLANNQPDFLWARFEYPTASQGFFLYSYPYEGPQQLTAEALLAARNKFAARIPGPSKGSYMTTSDVIFPDFRMFRLEGRLWCELRGFWDVHGDFMGGPFVSYTTVDTATGRVFTFDGYVYAPDVTKPRKRNYMRGVEHLLYGIQFPKAAETSDAASTQK